MKHYCLDTGVFIEGWNRYYSMDLCPQYWKVLDDLAKQGVIFSPIEVKREINTTDDDLKEWIKDKPHFFKEITMEVQLALRQLMADYGRLVDSIKQRSIADPWVIALAMVENAVVVTKETPSGLNSRRIKIPDVCRALNLHWMNDFEFAKKVGIRFTAQIR